MGREFVGRSTHRVLEEIERALGPDALIVSAGGERGSRSVAARSVEIVALRADEASAGASAGEARAMGWYGELRAAERGPGEAEPAAGERVTVRSLVAGLESRGLDAATGRALLDDALGRLRVDDLASAERLAEAVCDAVARRTPPAAPVAAAPGRTRRVAFVGPSGAGKTSALLRIAASLVGETVGVRVGVVRGDAVGADRLGALTAVLGIPVERIDTAREAKALAKGLRGGVLLVDTPGIGAADDESAARLVSFLRECGVDEAHVALPASVDSGDVEDLLGRLAGLPNRRALVTKVDETRALGRVIARVVAGRVPTSYLSAGRLGALAPAEPAALRDLARRALGLAPAAVDGARADAAEARA